MPISTGSFYRGALVSRHSRRPNDRAADQPRVARESPCNEPEPIRADRRSAAGLLCRSLLRYAERRAQVDGFLGCAEILPRYVYARFVLLMAVKIECDTPFVFGKVT